MVVRDVITRDSDGTTVDTGQEEAEHADLDANAKKITDHTTFLVEQFAYDSNNQVEYQGWALPGTATSAAGWRIKKLTYSGTLLTKTEFADGDSKMDNVWDDRESLSYS